MEYQLVFSSGLGITPADFVTAWNEEVGTQEVAQAELVPNPTKAFSGPVVETVLLVTNTIALPIATNALYELIKGVVVKQKKGKYKRTKITQFDQPDGTHVLVIEEEG
jgi:hypothetical protein